MSRARQQITIFLILLDISRRKENQTMKFDQLIENNLRNFFFKTHAENEVRSLLPEPLIRTSFCFFEKDVYKTKASDQHVSFNIFW